MTNKYTPWAETGDLETDTTFTTSEQAKGFLVERLRNDRLNRILNRVDCLANDVFGGRSSAMEGLTRDAETLENRYSDASTVAIACNGNRVSIGTTNSMPARVCPTRISGVRKVLVADFTLNKQIKVVDVETMAVDVTVTLAGLPSGTWNPVGICADGTRAFVLYQNSTSDVMQVQGYTMLTWDPLPLWPAEGTEVATEGPASTIGVNLIFADATYLAFGNPRESSNNKIKMLDRATGVISENTGKGDDPDSGPGYISLCSNGVNLFWYDQGYVCSARISDLTQGCGGSNWPRAISNASTHCSVACAGGLVAVCQDGTSNHILTLLHQDNAIFATIDTDLTNIVSALYSICSDGLNFYARGKASINATADRSLVFRIDPKKCIRQSASTAQAITARVERIVEPFAFDYASDAPTAPNINLMADDRDIWFGGYTASAGNALNQYVYRLPYSRWR